MYLLQKQEVDTRMIDQSKASRLAKAAFDQWQAGCLDQSKLLYEEAIPLADPQHWRLSTIHSEYACVLNEVGEHEQATVQMETSLAIVLAQGSAEGSPDVMIARYFLADQLRRHGSPGLALECLAPAIDQAPNDWLIRWAETHALFALNRISEAKDVAALAIANAPTPSKAEEIKQDLAQILGALDN